MVDDEPDLRTLYELTLLREGYDVESAASVDDAWQRLSSRTYSAVITDMRLPDGSGLDLLKRLDQASGARRRSSSPPTGRPRARLRRSRRARFDYLTKPVDLRQFRSVVASAHPVERRGSRRQGVTLRRASPHAVRNRAPTPGGCTRAVAAWPAARKRCSRCAQWSRRVARSMAPVLVQGESGTGKELVARAIHACSSRSDAPFIAVNCGAIPEQLLEAEFFGYRKGSFTGAHEDREGFVQAAQGGTLFLDEIGDLPLAHAEQAAARDPRAHGAAGGCGHRDTGSMCGWLAPPTRTWPAKCTTDASARTCSIA